MMEKLRINSMERWRPVVGLGSCRHTPCAATHRREATLTRHCRMEPVAATHRIRAWCPSIGMDTRATLMPGAPSYLLASGTVRPTKLRSEEHTSELQSLMRISYAVFCLKKKTKMTLLH